jgi:3-phenylpropionate/trans-cinnamate dioxygenase ferredoxin component
MSALEFTGVASLADVPDGAAIVRDLAGRSILICNFHGALFAIENRCSHAEEPLACGRIRNGWIACPAHGARFDLETGEALTGPAQSPIATFPLRVVGDMIEVAADA